MAMITTCPACHTRFRVSPEQMEAHGGDVRCGRCAKVFNAGIYMEKELEELQHEGQSRLAFDEPAAPAVTPAEAVSEEAVNVEVANAAPLTRDVIEHAVPIDSFSLDVDRADQFHPQSVAEMAPAEELAAPSFDEVPAAETLHPFPSLDERGAEPVEQVEAFVPEWSEAGSDEPHAPAEISAVELPASSTEQVLIPKPVVPEPLRIPATTPRSLFVSEPEYDMAEEPKKRSFFWLWLMGILLLFVTLLGQGMYFFRTELAARYPDVKPLLVEFCGVLECTVRLPANPDLLNIETSNLEADPQQANLVSLNAILRNRSVFAQEYPQLELTITNTQDQMIARRIFTPGEYARYADLSRGMTPNEEVTVKLYLDLVDLTASGYRVYLFYP